MPKQPMANISIDKAWFTARMHDKKLSQRRLGALLGMDQASLSQRLNGVFRFQLDEVADLARILGVPFDVLVQHLGVSPPRDSERQVLVMEHADERGVLTAAPPGEKRRVERPTGASRDTVAIRIIAPQLSFHGWIVYHTPTTRVDMQTIGRFGVIEGENRKRYLGVLRRGDEQGRWDVWAMFGNPEKPTARNIKLTSASPVISILP